MPPAQELLADSSRITTRGCCWKPGSRTGANVHLEEILGSHRFGYVDGWGWFRSNSWMFTKPSLSRLASWAIWNVWNTGRFTCKDLRKLMYWIELQQLFGLNSVFRQCLALRSNVGIPGSVTSLWFQAPGQLTRQMVISIGPKKMVGGFHCKWFIFKGSCGGVPYFKGNHRHMQHRRCFPVKTRICWWSIAWHFRMCLCSSWGWISPPTSVLVVSWP